MRGSPRVSLSPFLMWRYGVLSFLLFMVVLSCPSKLLDRCKSVNPEVTHLAFPASPALKQPSAVTVLLCVLLWGFSACVFCWQQPGVEALLDFCVAESTAPFREGVGCCVQRMLPSLYFSYCACSILSGLLPSHAQIFLQGLSEVLYFRNSQPLPVVEAT